MGKNAVFLHRLCHILAPNNKISVLPSDAIKNCPNYLHLLASCKNPSSLLQLHAVLIVSGLQNDHSTNTHLLKSYISFQKCEFARFLFDSMPYHTVRLYNSMIRAYASSKNHQEAIKMYHRMLNEGVKPDKYTFTFVLKACTGALEFKEGVLIHRDIAFRGLECDVFVGTALVDMYCKLGYLESAREVFVKMPEKDVITWNAMILCLSQSVDPQEALGFVKSMQSVGLDPDVVTIVNLVPAVSTLGDIYTCRAIHCYVIRKGFDAIVSDGLIDMYSKCGYVDMASQIFKQMKDKSEISWRTMMSGYAHNDCFFEVLELFDCMKRENHKLGKTSVATALLAAAEMRDSVRREEVHGFARQEGVDSDVLIATSLITMYAKFGDLDRAKQVFQGIKEKDVVAWSAIIAVLFQSGYGEDALQLFQDMQKDCFKANEITLMSVIPACAEILCLRLGKSVHCYAVKANYDSDVLIGTALLSMYLKCGSFPSALTIFYRMPCKDIVTWNSLINGYGQTGDTYHAMEMFCKLQISEIKPDSGTMVGLLSLTCEQDIGTCIHGQIIKFGFDSYCHVTNALIDMYAKCGSLSTAEFLFMSTEFAKNDVSWNILIAGYVHNGHAEKAISAFCWMKLQNFQPNLVTIVSVLPAVASLSALKEGMVLHAYIIQMGFRSNLHIGNSLIDMYAKCGQLHYSENMFHEMKNKNIVSWNVMLAAYAVHGQGNRAVELFSIMQTSHIGVDSLSFINVLSACRHAGLIDEGREIFDSMYKRHQLEPGLEHYACMVDLLGRAGLFDEILHLIKEMPLQPDAKLWGAILGACEMHSNVQLAEFALEHLVQLEPRNPNHHVALSNIYANSGKWEDAGSTRSKIIKTGLKKSPGWSWVSGNG
ncbi:pentatricopeptide repeat-containing protein At2g39620 [Euphorbia lathyris]|uniref:pentatricopeptide repeat-containing protein At2g39620 n=1 Tax=Euphorbia lathyris TaxID=212925 RepID=UPI003313B067